MSFDAPVIDYAGLSPVIALTAGLVVLVLVAVFDSVKRFGPAVALLAYAVTAGCLIWQWNADIDLVNGALRLDGLAVTLSLLAVIAAAVAVLRYEQLNDWANRLLGIGMPPVMLGVLVGLAVMGLFALFAPWHIAPGMPEP